MIRAAEPPSKVCCGCGQELPITDFRFRKRGEPGRQGCCRPCYNGRMRAYRFVRRSKTIQGFSAAVLREKRSDGVSRLCAEMFHRFGGPVEFASVWKTHLDAAPAGSRIALNTFLAIAQLVQLTEASGQPTDVSQLTDEELAQELDLEIQRLVSAEVQRIFADRGM